MPTQLERILAHTLIDVTERRANADVPALERTAAAHRPRGFEAALRSAAATGPAIIAELKKASPSRGLIRPDFDPAVLAGTLEEAGATALSVLTDSEFFMGSLADLELASKSVSIPCIRKDFILDRFQILEARAAGADAILLIVAAHTDDDLETLFRVAQGLDLDVLCEVHDQVEARRASDLGFTLIGVNSRDLRTMEVRPETQLELVRSLPDSALRVAESGIRNASDIQRLQSAGYQAFLVGESLMRQRDPAGALATLLEREYSPNI
jgi:indole-3-glycerol phosphate synthase